MSSPSGRRTTDRPSLPPIRDLFGTELNRLRVSDDDVPHYSDPQRQHSNVHPRTPYSHGALHPSSGFSSAPGYPPSITPHALYGREQNWSSPNSSAHSGYDPRGVAAMDHRHFARAAPAPAPNNYQYPIMRAGPPSNQYSSANPVATRDPAQNLGHRSYSNQDYPAYHRISNITENRGRSREGAQTSNQEMHNTSGDLPSSSAATPPAKYECSYCGKGFNRPSSLKIHLNSHTGEKRTPHSAFEPLPVLMYSVNLAFICPVEGCGRSFSVLSNMRRHARVHNQAAQTSDEDAVSLSHPGPSRTTVTPVNWHQYRRGSTASDVSSSESRHDRSESSDSEEEGYSHTHSAGKRVRQHHR
ncbi:hypothetical protein GGU10DRAFT_382798 [Lentinula aff. detonsa]|uniref:C2H2-type domain-containing protein n=1 Tax=Lentinula aff. detonsa TaxID=2804958 RepID=A0AA38NU07_9AGAR|nr:hypothetical protein GGU10DRAFT_382798 [Lentinula aff. detonsa]